MRRVLGRVLQVALLVLAFCGIILLLRSKESFRINTTSSKSSPSEDERLQDMRVWWARYERAMLDARPNANPIELSSGGAQTVSVEGDIFRTDSMNFVRNEGVVEELKRAQAQFRGILDQTFAGNGRPIDHSILKLFNGQGVVTVAGGEYYGPAMVGILMLRKLGSNLPVEVFVENKKSGEYEKEICETILPSMNARCVVLTQFLGSSSRFGSGIKVTHYQLKSLAMLFSSFKDVLYLDSDSIPLVDPKVELFTKEPYLSTGFVGWPDFWKASESPLFYKIAGLDGMPKNLPASSSEAGQLMLDKSKHLKTLLLAIYYNVMGPEWYYPLLSQGALGQGDKNTFESAATVLGLPWYRVRSEVHTLGRQDAGELRGSAMIQYHPGDDMKRHGESTTAAKATAVKTFTGLGPQQKVRPAFIHANTPKMNAGHLVDEGDLQDKASAQHIRLWGTHEQQMEIFGKDVEKVTFQYVVETGCKYVRMLKDWKHRGDICAKLMEHYRIVFYES
ncbi:nucleotide-diphospho-sugar transferase [Microthyrium microscopicum]|uniref:Nucleotide-diphospho-sugar transferase n=1 Tax=Microthyrium microscopicum TaxID=703497 RepID=A0A6A6UMQ6_9PEZI|nr:nucleotide-diphospho-sugar transferase [Microthyrium microscopicum]